MKRNQPQKKRNERKKTITQRLNSVVLKKPMGQWWDQRENLKIPWDEWQWKHNHTKSMRCKKSSL